MALLRGEPVAPPRDVGKSAGESFPVLIMHNWCPFTSPATSLWQDAAAAEGRSLRILFADTPEGEAAIKALDVRGVPCVAAAPGRLHYGMASPEEAASFLQE